MDILKQIADALLAGDDELVPALARGSLEQGLSPAEVLNGGLIAGMEEVGRQFKCHDNEVALDHIESAKLWLFKRTLERVARNVEGTMQQ